MNLIVRKSKLEGEILIPTSKSHTIRGVVFGSLAEGVSKLINPLDSADTQAAVNGCIALGAKIEKKENEWTIEGFNGKPRKVNKVLDMMNSGTSINLLTSVACLGNSKIVLDGDASLRRRPMKSLLVSLNELGAQIHSEFDNSMPPIIVKGPLKGGSTWVNCLSSQFVTSLLIVCPLIENDTEFNVMNLCEEPYIKLTMKWLDDMGVNYESDNLKTFNIKGGQKYKAFEKEIPADWSSAAFPLVGGAIVGKDVLVKGLDIDDIQGDKEIVDYLKKMNANISIEKEGIRIKCSKLHGAELDLNNTPDLVPVMAVIACFAKGKTRIKNVVHARLKETDRIKVMCSELKKMGADIKEFSDGLEIVGSSLHGAEVHGYHDHRVVMALSLAGMGADGETVIDTAESIGVTFPDFVDKMKKLNANMEVAKK